MGLSFRKSKSFGPFRINFSKSGIGLSAGPKGLRVATKPGSKGQVLRGGKGPLRLYKRLDARGKEPRSPRDVRQDEATPASDQGFQGTPAALRVEGAGTVAPKGRVRLDTVLFFDAVSRPTQPTNSEPQAT